MTQFNPSYTPKEMMSLGIFGGCYFSTMPEYWFELPEDWRKVIPEPINYRAKENYYMVSHNRFNVKVGTSLIDWQESGAINEQDPLGWFQWYCRYYQGRRTPDDARQIGRWRSFVGRHMGPLWRTQCNEDIELLNNLNLYPARRQALLHWGWDSTTLPEWW